MSSSANITQGQCAIRPFDVPQIHKPVNCRGTVAVHPLSLSDVYGRITSNHRNRFQQANAHDGAIFGAESKSIRLPIILPDG